MLSYVRGSSCDVHDETQQEGGSKADENNTLKHFVQCSNKKQGSNQSVAFSYML